MSDSDYQYTEVTGSSFMRCLRAVADNPLSGDRSISFSEERVMNLSDGVVSIPVGNLSYPIASAMSEKFDLLDPDTGGVTGTCTFGQAYAVVHSAYMHVAKARDQQGIPSAE